MPTPRLIALLAAFLALAGCSTRTVVVAEPAPRERVAMGPAATLGIPPGHMPRAGQCRIWIRGLPPGRQPRPKSGPCVGLAAAAPAGSWILYRPATSARLVHVRVVDEHRAGKVVRLRVFEIESGKFVREEEP
ncbi:MAG: hypothetical protein ACREKB_00895 [Candidatus Rokuibacteriota bacterium]